MPPNLLNNLTQNAPPLWGGRVGPADKPTTDSKAGIQMPALSSPVLENKDLEELFESFTLKLQNISENAVEIGQALQLLTEAAPSKTTLLYDYLDGKNKEAEKYIVKNTHALNNELTQIPQELLDTLTPEEKPEVIKIWNSPTLNQEKITALIKRLKIQINLALTKAITATPSNEKLILEPFYIESKSNLTPTPADQLQIKKTFAFLTSPAQIENVLYLTYLFLQSHVQHKHNDQYQTSIDLLLQKQGDCTEGLKLYNDVLNLKNIETTNYFLYSPESYAGHTFGSIKLENIYYSFDENTLIKDPSFQVTAKKISREKYHYYWRYNIQDYLNPALIPKKISATKFELIDLDTPP
jgi:hypothetical protein